MIGWVLAVGVALAQDTAAPEEPAPEVASEEASDPEGGEPSLTVVVVAERRVEMARNALILRAKEAGFTRERQRRDRLILRHDAPWKGDIVVHDDGRVELKRQPVRFEPPVRNPKPADYLWCVLFPLCIRPSGQTLGKRKFRAAEANGLAAIHPEVVTLDRRIAELGLARKVEDLPARLDALWERGVPLDADGPPIADLAARRAAVAAFWSSRTDTEEGRIVRDIVQAWVRNVVQFSEAPYSEAEIAAINASRRVPEAFLAPRAVPVLSEDD